MFAKNRFPLGASPRLCASAPLRLSEAFSTAWVRLKYVHREQRELPPVLAPAPERACGLAAPGLLAHLLVSKFSDHLPFYRQQGIYSERHGVFIARQQMVMWMKQGATLLEAIRYILNQWPALARILEHGEVEWTNNLVENKIRPTALGKKNWMFFGSEEAGERNAILHTLIANCRLHGIEPRAYLKDVLAARLPSTTHQHVAELTPLRWKKARQKPAGQAAPDAAARQKP